jgi:uridine kinase
MTRDRSRALDGTVSSLVDLSLGTDGPRLLGIAGGSGSGKTTVARALVEHLGQDHATLVSHDWYYHPMPKAYRDTPHTYNFDEPAALDNALLVRHLDALRRGESVRVPDYDFARHDRVGDVELHPRPVIVVEGILVFAVADLVDALDHRVFVHAPEHTRVARRIRRDQQDRGRALDDVLSQYFQTVRPMHETWVEPSRAHADLVLSGEAPVERSLSELLSLLQPDRSSA